MKKVLIIDDRPENLELMSFIVLCRIEAEIITAADVQQTLAQLELHKLDLIVSDYFLPDGNGDDILKHLKQSSTEIPFIFITCREKLELKTDYPVMDIITKKDYEKLFHALNIMKNN